MTLQERISLLITIIGTDIKSIYQYLNNAHQKLQFVAGENVTTVDLCYLKSDGKMWKASGSASASSVGLLGYPASNLSTGVNGFFILRGKVSLTDLTVGGRYYVSATSGQITTTPPTETDTVTRFIGYAISATELMFDPSNDYITRT